MTEQPLPSGGGSYEIDPKGNLTPLELPEATYDTTTDIAVVDQVPDLDAPVPAAEPPTKAARRAAVDVKEA